MFVALLSMLFSFYFYFLLSFTVLLLTFFFLFFVPLILSLSHPVCTLLFFSPSVIPLPHSLHLSTQVPLSSWSGRKTQTSSIAMLQWVFIGLWGRRHAGLDPREKGRKHWGRTRWCLGTAEKVWWVPNGKKEEPPLPDSFLRVIIVFFYPISLPK